MKKEKCKECNGKGFYYAPPTYPPKSMSDCKRDCKGCLGTGVVLVQAKTKVYDNIQRPPQVDKYWDRLL